MRHVQRSLRACFSAAAAAGASEIGWLLSASSAHAVHLHPGAHARVQAPPGSPATLTRAPAEQLVSAECASAPLVLHTPQRMESEVQSGGSVHIHGKLEGSCAVRARGDIVAAGTLRGAYVDLQSAEGRVDVMKVLEGVSAVRARLGLRCARAMGERMALRTEAGELHVGAAFGEVTLEHAAAAAPPPAGAGAHCVHLGGVHGSARILSASAPVTAVGVTGRLRVSGAPAACTAQFDSVRGDCSITGVAGSVEVRVCPPLRLQLRVAAGGGLRVDAGPGGSFEGGVLVAPGPAAGAGEADPAGRGGSGKIRDGSAITGWWSQEPEGGAEGSAATLTISCSGSASVTVQTYEEKLAQQQQRPTPVQD